MGVRKSPISILFAVCAFLVLSVPFSTFAKKGEGPREENTSSGPAVLWREPTDIAARDLFYGPGGKEHEPPQGTFVFVKEDLDGTNPKFVVRDQDGVKWKVKLGLEARPETVASRLAWAAGYFVDEDYFVQDMHIQGMPARLHRGQKLVAPDGSVHNVRLKRESKEEKKIGSWLWSDDPFTGSREWNGLRTLMAVINNWDLKDENNAVYKEGSENRYMVSDLGASFGSAGRTWPRDKAKGNLDSYSHARFIRKLNADSVDFAVPGRPRFVYLVTPRDYFSRIRLESIGKNVPRKDARWMGQLLARLSPAQIADAFRAAGYSPQDVQRFSEVLQNRIEVLTDL
jgi:hypothetical protein